MRVRRQIRMATTRCCIVSYGQEQGRRHSCDADNSSDPLEVEGVKQRWKLARKACRGKLVLWQERPQGERVLEEARRFGENRIRILADRTQKSATITLR